LNARRTLFRSPAIGALKLGFGFALGDFSLSLPLPLLLLLPLALALVVVALGLALRGLAPSASVAGLFGGVLGSLSMLMLLTPLPLPLVLLMPTVSKPANGGFALLTTLRRGARRRPCAPTLEASRCGECGECGVVGTTHLGGEGSEKLCTDHHEVHAVESKSAAVAVGPRRWAIVTSTGL
jgi:hypothetical protein